jgi:hypothetical protein
MNSVLSQGRVRKSLVVECGILTLLFCSKVTYSEVAGVESFTNP